MSGPVIVGTDGRSAVVFYRNHTFHRLIVGPGSVRDECGPFPYTIPGGYFFDRDTCAATSRTDFSDLPIGPEDRRMLERVLASQGRGSDVAARLFGAEGFRMVHAAIEGHRVEPVEPFRYADLA